LKKKILVFSPSYNEKIIIKKFIKEFFNYNKIDLLIIDDNSPDGTANIIKSEKIKNKFIKLIVRKKKNGIDTAHIDAYKYAIKKNYDYLITLDCDLQHDVADIKRFAKELNFNNFIIGSRYMLNGKCNLKGFRYLLSYYGNKFLKYLFKIKINEFTTSFRGFDKKTLRFLIKKKIVSRNYSFFMEVVYILNKYNFKLKEIPIIFNSRKLGYSKIPKTEILRTLYNAARLKLFY
jgi:dolichol-phosphate mannosyltransferase